MRFATLGLLRTLGAVISNVTIRPLLCYVHSHGSDIFLTTLMVVTLYIEKRMDKKNRILMLLYVVL